ncbi:hypothetical protein MNR02_06425 [Shinella sp. H4-D48]|uniref:hypothetical protein n=1 Tax=Shinella sp. H4-D48 TaxID=2925841 RepID=UPI001F53D087|nr:hypothetical protein [Shinella sp. H4-D48]UNK39336.1 hypothetical protein MNR02_06425 [Shinella sp. H4-D48]
MSPEQRRMLAALVEKHPNMRVSSLMAKLRIDIKVNQLRKEIGHKPDRSPAQSAMLDGITEGLI